LRELGAGAFRLAAPVSDRITHREEDAKQDDRQEEQLAVAQDELKILFLAC
jgi:hypothetical protein